MAVMYTMQRKVGHTAVECVSLLTGKLFSWGVSAKSQSAGTRISIVLV